MKRMFNLPAEPDNFGEFSSNNSYFLLDHNYEKGFYLIEILDDYGEFEEDYGRIIGFIDIASTSDTCGYYSSTTMSINEDFSLYDNPGLFLIKTDSEYSSPNQLYIETSQFPEDSRAVFSEGAIIKIYKLF